MGYKAGTRVRDRVQRMPEVAHNIGRLTNRGIPNIMKLILTPLALVLALVACTKTPDPTAPPKPKTAEAAPAASTNAVTATVAREESGIAWQKGDVDAAFAK